MYCRIDKNIIAIATEPIGVVLMCNFAPITENKTNSAKRNHILRML